MQKSSPITSSTRTRLVAVELRRALCRRHRKCSTCKSSRILCSLCAHMWCPNCHNECPFQHHHTPTELPAGSTSLLTAAKAVVPRTTERRKKLPPECTVPPLLHQWKAMVNTLGCAVTKCVDQNNKYEIHMWTANKTSTPRRDAFVANSTGKITSYGSEPKNGGIWIVVYMEHK